MKHTVTRDRRRMLRADYAALGPYSLWALLFILVPLVFVAYYAFTDNNFQFTLENVQRFFTATSSVLQEDGSSAEVHTYLLIFWRSLKLAVISTVICLVLAYPLAYIMARAKPRTQKIFLTIIMIPMWMNFLLRTIAWMSLLEDNGLINTVLRALGFNGVQLMYNSGAVLLGMVYNFLPFMVFPIYTLLSKMDYRLTEAAADLGCNNWQTLWKVTMPLSIPGIVSGITMVFMPSVTTFFIPRVLGGGNTMMSGDLIEAKFLTEGNWNVGSALSLIMMVLILISLSILRKADPNGEGGGIA